MSKIPSAEGTSFAVPLPTGGYGLGVVARRRKNKMLAYFSAERCPSTPTLQAAAGLKAPDAVLVALVSVMAISEGKWPVIGHLKDWHREDWPIPDFHRYSDTLETYYRVHYSGDTLDERPSEVEMENDGGLPSGGSFGYDAAVAVLEMRLAKPSNGTKR
jgi:hypothetical protein